MTSFRLLTKPGATGGDSMGSSHLFPRALAKTAGSGRGLAPERTKAQARRNREEYDHVELDDEYTDSSFNLDFLPATGGRLLRAVQNATDRFIDVAYDLAPAGTSRSVVETATKGGILLVAISFASSILSFLLNAGLIILALYIAAKMFGIEVGPFQSSSRGSIGRPSKAPPKEQRRSRGYKTDVGQAASDLTDVWFERKPPGRGSAR